MNEGGPVEEPDVEDNRKKRVRKREELQKKLKNEIVFSDEDTSDEEDVRNTVGNIPMFLYNDYQHIGYDLDGRKLMKPIGSDRLEEFINNMDDPDSGRTVIDPHTGQKVILSDEDLDIVQRILSGRFPDSSYDPHEPWIDIFSHEKMIHPVRNNPIRKESFIPSLDEKRQVSRYVWLIKAGKIKLDKEPKNTEPVFFHMWKDSEEAKLDRHMRHMIRAPKMKLPGYEESYNPPPEYLLNEDELKKVRKGDIVPKKYGSLREVPAYSKFINERFERCMDLYLCPRQKVTKKQTEPEDLLPEIPKAKDLQPFPTVQAVVYRGHTDVVTCLSVEPLVGEYIASGSKDRSIRIWEVSTGRCMKVINTAGPVISLSWRPDPPPKNNDETNIDRKMALIAAVVGHPENKKVPKIILVNAGVGDKLVVTKTDEALKDLGEASESGENSNPAAVWEKARESESKQGIRMFITLHKEAKDVSQVVWHGMGDYFATAQPLCGSYSVILHQLSKQRSQRLFDKSFGAISRISFYNDRTRTLLFATTPTKIRVYDVLKLKEVKQLSAATKYISSVAVHPGGDHVITGGYDARLNWHDLELSTKSYKNVRNHKKAIRQVCFHRMYPLFASCSDDCTLTVFHGQVYSDLQKNALIVPLKILRGHKLKNEVGVTDCQFHPTQPWIFSAGGDTTLRLFV